MVAKSPIRDPYYRKIVEGLGGHLDPVLFENIAVRLLRVVQPGIAALPGGSDQGRDGLIPDWKGEPYPPVITTGEPLRNLRKSLDRIATDPDHRNRVIFATSRALTPKGVEKLFDHARDRGFTLLAAYQQQDFADWLYRDAPTCRELLGLSGKPAALSAVPSARRTQADVQAIGREKDLDWLRGSEGDRVLAGQPGSGKTFLLRQLVREGRGLFLVSDDPAAVADELREKYDGRGPKLIFVDDAHAYPSRVELLRRLREEIGAAFDLVATTWPGHRAEVKAAMGGASDRTLELMPRDDLVALYRRLGIPESLDADLVRELVDQASNRPGLAATLASLWLRGQWREVLTGEALAEHIRVDLERLLGFDPTPLLAVVALSGFRGMPVESVAGALGRPRGEVWRELTEVGHTGFLENAGDRQALQPRRLRGVLVRDVFLPRSGPPLPYRSILESFSDNQPVPGRASDRGAAVEVLVEARAVGGRISDHELRERIESSKSTRAWEYLASLDRGNAVWALEHFPGAFVLIAPPALRMAPDETIWESLQRAAEERDEPRGTPYHQPLPVLAEWVADLGATAQWVPRRLTVAKATMAWWRESGYLAVALEAASIALSPRLHSSRADPGIGMMVTYSMAILPPSDIGEMRSVWRILAPLFEPLVPAAWLSLRSVLQDWMRPEALFRGVSSEGADAARDFARWLLSEVTSALSRDRALATDAQALATSLGMTLDVESDPLLDVLFPSSLTVANVQELEPLAAGWAKKAPADVAARLVSYAGLAAQIGRTSRSALVELAKLIAAAVEDPEAWVEALLDADLRVDVVDPFVLRLLEAPSRSGEGLLRRALSNPRLSEWAAMVVLQSEQPSGALLDQAIGLVETQPDLVETACLRNELPLETTERILHSPDLELRAAAITGVWNADSQGDIPAELRSAWEQAALQTDPAAFERSRALRYWFPEILRSAPRLAERWLEKHAAELRSDLGSVVIAAVEAIGPDARRRLVSNLPPAATFVLASLVREEPALYEPLLSRSPPVDDPLSPLAHTWKTGDPRWLALARIAVAAGQAPQDVASAILGTYHFAGPGVDHWQRWEEAFAALERDSTGSLQETARQGLKLAAAEKESALARERRIALRGIA